MILELKKQVTSLEISKKLRELGVRQDSLYFHCETSILDGEWHSAIVSNEEKGYLISEYNAEYRNVYAAYTVAELGVLMLPNYCVIEKKFENGLMRFRFSCVGHQSDCSYGTEAECRGNQLLWLIENGYFKSEYLS